MLQFMGLRRVIWMVGWGAGLFTIHGSQQYSEVLLQPLFPPTLSLQINPHTLSSWTWTQSQNPSKRSVPNNLHQSTVRNKTISQNRVNPGIRPSDENHKNWLRGRGSKVKGEKWKLNISKQKREDPQYLELSGRELSQIPISSDSERKTFLPKKVYLLNAALPLG